MLLLGLFDIYIPFPPLCYCGRGQRGWGEQLDQWHGECRDAGRCDIAGAEVEEREASRGSTKLTGSQAGGQTGEEGAEGDSEQQRQRSPLLLLLRRRRKEEGGGAYNKYTHTCVHCVGGARQAIAQERLLAF